MAEIRGNLEVIGNITAHNFTGSNEINFSYGDASPVTVMTASSGMLIEQIQILILTEFDGLNSSLKVGDSGQDDRLLSENQIYPNILGTYTSNPNYKYVSSTPILLTIDPSSGASQGQGLLIIKYKS